MLASQTIPTQGDQETILLSPWFPRGGDYGLFTLEVTAIGGTGTPTLTVTMVVKDSDEAGEGTEYTGLSIARTSVGRTTVDFANGAGSPAFGGFKQMVRYRFKLSGGSTGTTWVTFRMLAAVWYDKV
jgi:hypothetical protein